MRSVTGRVLRRVAVLVCALPLAHCAPPPPAMEAIRARGELRVATLNIPTAYYLGAHGPEGQEFELARSFGKRLDLAVYVYPVASETALREELASGRADIAAAQLTWSEAWKGRGLPTGPYDHVPQVVVHRRNGVRPADRQALTRGRLVVSQDSAHVDIQRSLEQELGGATGWVALPSSNDDPLAAVADRRADFAIVDATAFAFARHLYPTLAKAFELDPARPVQWIVRPGADDLRAEVDAFFTTLAAEGELGKLLARARGDSRGFQFVSATGLLSHIDARLPPLQSLFEQASAVTGVDWRLLAAIGYQESQWNPVAESPNGAGGIMMLMPDTATSLGVTDRTDAKQNILAGAKYFLEVRDKIPPRIQEPDRTWLTLAAYNVGFGHLEDARVITQAQGGDPDRWRDVRERLPLLTQEAWYLRAKHGYARGWEPVQFVDRVQQFLNVLEWRSTALAREPAPEPNAG